MAEPKKVTLVIGGASLFAVGTALGLGAPSTLRPGFAEPTFTQEQVASAASEAADRTAMKKDIQTILELNRSFAAWMEKREETEDLFGQRLQNLEYQVGELNRRIGGG